MEFARGKTTKSMHVVGSCQTTGTKITFMPDDQIFDETKEFKFDVLAKRLRELAFLNPGLSISLKDDKSNREDNFIFEDGISEYVLYLNQNKNCLIDKPISFDGEAPAESGDVPIKL
jgi:DNA gyrase subunit B